jgi:hypothetical protein
VGTFGTDENMKAVTQLVTTSIKTVNAMASSDFVDAFDTLNTNGWKIVETVTPEQSQQDAKFANAKTAWWEAFSAADPLVRNLVSGNTSENKPLFIKVASDTVSKALTDCSTSMPENAKYFDAVGKLYKDVSESGTDFSKAMGWIDASSLIQIDGNSQEDPQIASKLLSTGTLIITSLIQAFSADPPDVEFAIDTVRLHGWRVIKLVVPEEKQDPEKMKDAKKAWSNMFLDAPELVENAVDASKNGDTSGMLNAILPIIEAGLSAAAGVATEQKLLGALAEVINRLGGSIVEFSVTMGYMS